MRRYLICGLIILMMLGLSGCMKQKDYSEEMLTYLENKYHEGFEARSYFHYTESGSNANTDILYVYPKENPKQLFKVGVQKDGSEFYDYYQELVDSEKITALLENELKAVSPAILDVRVFIYDDLTKYLDDGGTVESFVTEKGEAELFAYFVVEAVTYEERFEIVKTLRDLLKNRSERNLTLSCMFVSEEDKKDALESNILAVSDSINWPFVHNDGVAGYITDFNTTDEEIWKQITTR